jgi:N-methylhydantoinase B
LMEIDHNGHLDSLSYEVVEHKLQMLAEEGGVRAARSAGNDFMSGRGSCASAIFTHDGLLIAQTLGGMQHVSAVEMMMMAIMERFPASAMREGDVYLCNDPFMGGIHPTDLGCFRPIFHGGQLAYFSGMLMVVADMGGMSVGGLPATATEVFHEGLVLPPTRAYTAGVADEGLMAVLYRNSRLPKKLRTDVEALVGATAIVDRRMQELIGRIGASQLTGMIARLLDHSEAMVRNGIAALPDGQYTGSYLTEHDGVSPIPSYEVKVRITIDGDNCHFDFSGTAPQAAGAINSSLSQSMSFVTYALRCYLDPSIPMNKGFYRPFTCHFPLGSLVNPRFPAASNLRFAVGQAMVDAIHIAMRAVSPDRSIAPSSALVSVNAHGRVFDPEKVWAFMEVQFGPSGGRTGADANDGMAFPMIGGGGYWISVEYYESAFPVIYERVEFVPDTGGPGRWRGGVGVSKDIRFFEDCVLTIRATDRTALHPQGAEGGGEGRGGGFVLNPDSADRRMLPSKATNLPVEAGDVLRLGVSGGGGYGDPFDRDPQMVVRDIHHGLVSPDGARRDYGVVVDQLGALDSEATIAFRTQSRGVVQ